MSLPIVASKLNEWYETAALKAQRANNPDTIAQMNQAAAQFKALMEAVQAGARQLEALTRQLAEGGKPKAATSRAKGAMTAIELWDRYGQAVNAIVAVYGTHWKTVAPLGDTVLVTVPAGLRSAKGKVKGVIIKWGQDHRMPAARFWPGGVLPSRLIVHADYVREDINNPAHRDAAWHRANGYVWHGGEWLREVEVRLESIRLEAIEDYRAVINGTQRMAA